MSKEFYTRTFHGTPGDFHASIALNDAKNILVRESPTIIDENSLRGAVELIAESVLPEQPNYYLKTVYSLAPYIDDGLKSGEIKADANTDFISLLKQGYQIMIEACLLKFAGEQKYI